MKRSFAIACCILGLAVSSVRAQPLADHAPADTLLYVGWAGANSLGAEYNGTHMQAVLAESRVRDLFGPYLDQLEEQIVRQEPDAREPFRIARTLGAPFWKYPTALVVTTVDDPGEGTSPVRLMIMTQAGADAKKLGDEWTRLIQQIHNPGPASPRATVAGDVVCLSIGYGKEAPAMPNAGGSLATAAPFAAAVKQVGGSKPMLVAYLDIEGATAAAERALDHQADQVPPWVGKIRTFIDVSGLRGVKRYVATAGFDGKDWVEQSFFDAPAPRAGLLTAWPEGPVDASLLKAVPADASFYASIRFNPAKFIRETQNALKQTDQEASDNFNKGVGMLQQALGTNVVDNVLEPLGDDWAFYNSPRVGSAGFLGMVMINKPDNAETLRRGLNTASINVANWANVGLSQMIPNMTGGVRAEHTKIGDAEITYFTTPIAAPAWAISDGRLYVGLYPQVVGAAIRESKKGGPSLADSGKYKALIARLGVKEAGTTSFYDLQGTAGYSQMYTSMLVIGRYIGIADLFGPPLPEPLLPPLDTLLDNLGPAGSMQWTDAAGWHSKTVTPFPGANLLTEQGAISSIGVGSTALGTSILLPSLNRARETANRVKSQSNLRQIGLGLMMYANANRGLYPEDLAALIQTQDLTPEVFISPRTGNALPPGNDPQAQIDYAAEQGDYVYIGRGLRDTATAETIVAYERPDGVEDGISVLYGDGHVDFLMMDYALQEIEKQKQARGIE